MLNTRRRGSQHDTIWKQATESEATISGTTEGQPRAPVEASPHIPEMTMITASRQMTERMPDHLNTYSPNRIATRWNRVGIGLDY